MHFPFDKDGPCKIRQVHESSLPPKSKRFPSKHALYSLGENGICKRKSPQKWAFVSACIFPPS